MNHGPTYSTCPKHGCVMTETITDDVFCGVCRTVELKAQIELLTENRDCDTCDHSHAGFCVSPDLNGRDFLALPMPCPLWAIRGEEWARRRKEYVQMSAWPFMDSYEQTDATSGPVDVRECGI